MAYCKSFFHLFYPDVVEIWFILSPFTDFVQPFISSCEIEGLELLCSFIESLEAEYLFDRCISVPAPSEVSWFSITSDFQISLITSVMPSKQWLMYSPLQRVSLGVTLITPN